MKVGESDGGQNLQNQRDGLTKKDTWDILGIAGTISSIISTVILGILTISFNKQPDEVKNSIARFHHSVAKAQLVQNLIEDLRTNDTRQDFALIGLNRSIGDVIDDPTGSDRLLVVQIANTAFQTRVDSATRAMSTKTDLPTTTALQVMTERCSENTPAVKVRRTRATTP